MDHHRRGSRLRFHQRVSRHCQRHSNINLDARTVASGSRGPSRRIQPHRSGCDGGLFPGQSLQHDRKHTGDQAWARSRGVGTARCNCMESGHLVSRTTQQLHARADRRSMRCWGRCRRRNWWSPVVGAVETDRKPCHLATAWVRGRRDLRDGFDRGRASGPLAAGAGQPYPSRLANRNFCLPFLFTRRQRRAEDDGGNHPRAGCRRRHSEVPGTDLGGGPFRCGNRLRNVRGWVANHSHARLEHFQTRAGNWILCPADGSKRYPGRHAHRSSSQHNTRCHRVGTGGWRKPQPRGSPLGGWRKHRCGVDHHHPRLSPHRMGRVCDPSHSGPARVAKALSLSGTSRLNWRSALSPNVSADEGATVATKILDVADVSVIRAAGGVVVRNSRSGEPEIAVIHRPEYDDWTLPKGKIEPDETPEDCALREVREETGLRCDLVRPLGCTAYVDRRGRDKVACYWVMEVRGGRFKAGIEVDKLQWLPMEDAVKRLTYGRDKTLLLQQDLT